MQNKVCELSTVFKLSEFNNSELYYAPLKKRDCELDQIA